MPGKPISVRQAGAADNHCLAILGRETFYDSFAADNQPQDMAAYLEQSFSPSIQAAELVEPSSCFLIAEAEGLPVGYARLVEGPAPPCIRTPKPVQIARLYARKPWIGRGVGAALMAACLAGARSRQGDGIWLGVWGRNTRALQFYGQWGFSEVGAQPFLLGNDRQTDLILWLPLKPAGA